MPEPRSFIRSAKIYRNHAVRNHMPTVRYGQWHIQGPADGTIVPVCGKDLSGEVEVLVTTRNLSGVCKACVKLGV